MRIVFAGTPEFALPALTALIDSGRRPVAVLTQPDRRAGRGRKLVASPVKRLALESAIPVHQPPTLRDPASLELLDSLRPELIVVVAYGLIVPPAVLALPPLGCWNIHASLLPRWRGAAPVQRALLAGDRETGACIMRLDAGLDTGPILDCARTAIDPQESAGSLSKRLARIGADLLLECLARRTELVPRPQPDEGVTYAHKIDKAEAALDWRHPAAELARQVRAFDPWPVAVAFIDAAPLRIWRAEAIADATTGAPGEILDSGPAGIDVATGTGALRLQEVQRAGGRRMTAAAYLNARALRPGDRFDPPPDR